MYKSYIGRVILYFSFFKLYSYTKECVSFIMITDYNNICSIHNGHYTQMKNTQ